MKKKCSKSGGTLKCAKTNLQYKIIGFTSEINFVYKRRLCEMGFLPQEKIVVEKKSFQSKTFLVQVRGVKFCLRDNLAECILVVAK